MDWFKKHADTLVMLATILGCYWNINDRLNAIEKDMAVVKTVLIMRNLMPTELAQFEGKDGLDEKAR